MCRRFIAVLSLLFLLLFPSFALAEEGSLGGDLLPEAVNNPTVQRIGITDTYFVYAPSNEFDAALAIIGETSTKIQLDTPKFTALSNEATGGDFYDLAQLCYSAEDGNPVNPANAIWYPMVQAKIALFGESHVWFCEATEAQINAAHRDYMTVLNGGSLGGGSSSGGQAVYLSNSGVFIPENRLYSSSFTCDGETVYTNNIYEGSGNYDSNTSRLKYAKNAPLSFNVVFTDNVQSDVDNYTSQGYKVYLLCNIVSSNVSMNLLLSKVEPVVTERSGIYEGQTYKYNEYKFTSVNTDDIKVSTYSHYLNPVDGVAIWEERRFQNVSSYTYRDNQGYNYYSNLLSSSGGGTSGDNNWPDPTPIPSPTAPEVPTPDLGDPVTEPSEPTDITFSPTLVVAPTDTSPTDYTPWLRAILQALNTIIDDMSRHCDHIKVAIRDWTQWLSERIDYLMYEYLDNLQTYLHQLFEWLANEISFNFDAGDYPLYDDSRLIAWLRRIYYQLGSPVKTTTNVPSDKDVEEGFDFWAWLLGLINRYLGGIIEDFVGDIGGFLSELVDTFPFSIPWDMLAYLTLLDAQRETPRIVVTIPAVSGWWSSYDVVIDCAPYDTAMATVRAMVLIWWGLVLLMRTSWLDEILKSSSSLVTGFFDRLTSKAVTD